MTKSPTRYEPDVGFVTGAPEMYVNTAGSYIKFEDYEQLKARLDAVVAECATQKGVIDAVVAVANQSQGISGWHLNGAVAGWGEILPEIYDIETPNVTAALAEVEAKAALPANWDDLLFNEMNRRFELKRHDDDYLTNGDTQIGVEFAIEFIKQLREARV